MITNAFTCTGSYAMLVLAGMKHEEWAQHQAYVAKQFRDVGIRPSGYASIEIENFKGLDKPVLIQLGNPSVLIVRTCRRMSPISRSI